jgi:hypothetical protein
MNTASMTNADSGRFPFGGGELRTRADFQRALLGLCEPFADAGGLARQLAAVAQPGAHYEPRVARLELVSRLLWGLAPLAAGGGAYPGWQPIREAIIAGTDPGHPDYWGPPSDYDQRIVESAALGFGLTLCPGELWEPLDGEQRARLAAWLRQAAHSRAHDNNWLLFATLVGLGLAAVGEPLEPEVTEAAFERVDTFYRGEGWYTDGDPDRAVDHYGPWALHFYGLVNARLRASDPDRAGTALERARAFAPQYLSWFAADGAGLAFGRSMTYRFAQAAFFGALAYADEPGPDGWGVLRGAWARHLRWWANQPILHGDGTLSLGYAYPNLQMSEAYNSPASPYWAFKAFLPLALPEDHPFWTHPEQPAPRAAAAQAYPTAGMAIRHDRAGHATALAAAPGAPWSRHRHAEAKYAKFAYSTAFGFAVPTAPIGLESAAIDSMLAFSEEGRYWRARRENVRWSVEDLADDGPVITAVWSPWPDVEVETRLRFAGDWQIREHRVTTARSLRTAEGAFCVPLGEDSSTRQTDASALAVAKGLASGIRDLTGGRRPAILRPDPNGHLLWPRTLLPALQGELAPGEHRLITAVYADGAGDAAGFEARPLI